MKYVYLMAGLLFCISAISQTSDRASVKVRIENEMQQPMQSATAYIVRAKDSGMVKAAVIDSIGSAAFENIKFGDYRIKVTALGYTTSFSESFSLNAGNPFVLLPVMKMKKMSGQLAEVTVSTKKPFIQRLNDRLIVNVDNNSINAGSSGLEILERSPGVNVDINDVISLRGKDGVTVMIDGRVTPISGSALINMLRSMPANSIESIHLITNPSARYDAQGNSGIIDIRMKKDQKLGTNGSITAMLGQGVYVKTNTGISVNYRDKKVNLYGNYNFVYREGLNHLIIEKNFFNNGVLTGQDLKENYARAPLTANPLRLGLDFFASKKTILGIALSGTFDMLHNYNTNHTTVNDQQKSPVFNFKAYNGNENHIKNGLVNLNFKHRFDDKGREITADIDFYEYNNRALSSSFTQYAKPDGTNYQPNYTLNGDQSGKLSLKTGKVDYSLPLKNAVKIETGFKTSFVRTDNDAKFFDVSNGTPVSDVHKTNHFYYSEKTNAAYASVSKDMKKFNFLLGLRAENTEVTTHQIKGDVRWDSSYLQLFPSAYLTYKIKDNQSLGISVSRRIGRPSYSQLNPFLFLIDVTSYFTGNPSLLPQFTWNYELNYNIKNINVGLSYVKALRPQTSVITRFRDIFPTIPAADNVTVQIPVNLNAFEYMGLSVSAPIRVSKIWSMVNNLEIYQGRYQGALGITKLNRSRATVDFNTNNNFTFKKGWGADLSGVFNTGRQSGFSISKPTWGISAGVQKTLMENKATLRFNVTDIFWTNLPRANITYDNYTESWKAYRETRTANISFSYRFGKKTVAAARRRTTGSEEERQRAQ